MLKWQNDPQVAPFPWLLEQENPSARYLTLRHLLDHAEQDSQVTEVRAAIAGWPPVREILAAMDAENFWGRADRPFYGGAVGTHATLHLLAELGLPRTSPIEAACENLFARGQHTCSGFTCDGTPGQIMLCYTGNAIRTLAHFGYLGNPRLEGAFEYLVARSVSPGGLTCSCAGGEECQWGIAKVLAAFAVLPAAERTPERLRAVRTFADAVLDHEFDLKGHDKRWRDFGFPLDYQSDLIELCDALARLDYGTDPRFQRLLKVVLKARTRDGRWLKRYGTRALQVEERGQPSKWITIRALRAIKHTHEAMLQAERARLRESEVG
jgi:hypothetical protein